jgi:hypothetical protein
LTTDGSCGASFGDKLCGDWPQGSCCSSYGSCGSSDAHCGDGCQSGPCKDGSGIVVLDPSVWKSPSPTAACYPPCTFVFPSQTLSSAQTITVPPATETIKEILSGTSNGNLVMTTIIKTTTITIPVITTTILGIYEFNWTDSGSSTVIPLTSSVTPPPMTITESSSSGLAGWIWTYHPLPIILPTITVGVNPQDPQPTIAIKPGPPKSVCKGKKCTPHCKSNCDPKHPHAHCSGICGCIGPFCPRGGKCVGSSCPKGGADPGDDEGGADPGDHEGGASPGDDEGDDSCTSKKTASTCTTTKTSSVFPPATTWTTWSYSDCKTRTGCSVTDSSTTTTRTGTYALPTPNMLDFDDFDNPFTTVAINAERLASVLGNGAGATMSSMSRPGITSKPTQSATSAPSQNTNFISCSHRNQNPGQGIYTAYCVCDGSTFAENLNTAVTPHVSCAYTEKPTSTAAVHTGFAATTNMDKCQVCTRVSPNQQDCTSLSNCTPKPTTPPSSPSTRCISAHALQLSCATPHRVAVQIWDDGVKVCDIDKDPLDQNSKTYDFECGNDRSVSVARNAKTITYNAPDGSITLQVDFAAKTKTGYHADKCAGEPKGRGSIYEVAYQGGQCTGCPAPDVCGEFSCGDFDGKCE